MKTRKIISLLLSFVFISSFCQILYANVLSENQFRLIFTTDIHSNIDPARRDINGKIDEYGGFSRIATIVNNNYIDGKTLVVDSGDFSMGTLYQTLLEKNATELKLFKQMRYDVVAIGNHEFDMGTSVLLNELTAAGNEKPDIVCSNITPADDKSVVIENDKNPLKDYGVNSYYVKEINGVKIGIFTLMGVEASKYVFIDEYGFSDIYKYAEKMTNHLRNTEKVDVVLLLSHCGTNVDKAKSEDEILAQKVKGIDIIISGHSHITETEPILVNNTTIFAPGPNGVSVGVIDVIMKDSKPEITFESSGYLTNVNSSVEKNPEIENVIETVRTKLKTDYLDKIDKTLSMTDEVAYSDFTSLPIDIVQQKMGNYPIGDIVTDSFLFALDRYAGIDDVDFAVTPVGIIRNDIFEGILTVSDIYNILSYGTSPRDNLSGSSLGVYYVYGEDLSALCEVDVSISPFMYGAQLFFSGLKYEYLPSRIPFSKVVRVSVFDKEKNEYVPIEKDKLYKAVMTTSTAQLVGVVGEQSFGLLNLTIRDSQGNPIDSKQIDESIVTYMNLDGEECEIKEWYALYSLLSTRHEMKEGLPLVPLKYETAAINKIEITNPSFSDYFTNPGKIVFILLIVIVVLVLIVVGIIVLVKRRKRNKRVI